MKRASLSAGDELNHYRIESALGAGGMGEVYLARDTRLDRDVALKVLPDALIADPTARARLVREAKTASALNHPNICHIYEVGESSGHSYIAMEHVEGCPLSQSIPADGLPLETTLRYAGQLAEALAHAHDRSVLHRDLKSSNVMVTPEGRVKVLDFGLAKRTSSGAGEATRAADSVTQAGSVAGTLLYLAPEVLRGQAADARSDLWALGVILYEMATGKLPFSGRTGFEASAAIMREPPQALPAHVPAGLRSVIARCLAKEAAQRYQRASELRAALEAISSATGAVPVTPPPAPAPEPRRSHNRVIAVLRSIFRPAGSNKVKESWSVLGVWLAWMLSLIVLWGVFVVVSKQLRSWLQPSQPASESTTTPEPGQHASHPAEPAGVPRLSTGGKPSPNPEANSYLEKAMLFLRGQLDVPRARQLLEKALQADPKFAAARTVYALTHILQIETGVSNETVWLYKAEQEVQQALRDDPDSVSAQGLLGAVYLMQGKKEAAGRQLQHAFELDSREATGRIWLMRYHWLNGDYPAAISLARGTLEISPTFWASQQQLGQMLHQSGDPAGAVREFGGVLDQDPQNIFALKELARGHIESGDTKTARMFLERTRPPDRQNYRIRLGWALIFAREGNRREALKEMDAELQKFAEVSSLLTVEAAEFYALLGDKRQALDWLEKAVRNGDERVGWFQRDPLLESIRNEFRFKSLLDSIAFRRQPAAARQLSNGGRPSPVSEANEYFEKAELFMGRGRNDPPQARRMLERALQLDPQFPEARASYGFTYFIEVDSGLSNDANLLYKGEEEIRRALRSDPSSASAHSALAAIYLLQGRTDLASDEVRESLRINPLDMNANHWRMHLHRLRGDSTQAIAISRQNLERMPVLWPARMNLGDILRTQGDLAGARREQEKILEQDPANTYAISNLARTYLDLGNLQQARSALLRLPQAGRQNFKVRLVWALLLAREGKKEEALKEMDTEVLKFAENNCLVILEPAEFYTVMGEKEKALEWLDKAVRQGDHRKEWFERDPLLAGIRKEPRFRSILDSIAYRRQQKHQ